MRHVIETLDGWVPSDDYKGRGMRWMPPEKAVVERAKLDAEALAAAVELGEIIPEPAR